MTVTDIVAHGDFLGNTCRLSGTRVQGDPKLAAEGCFAQSSYFSGSLARTKRCGNSVPLPSDGPSAPHSPPEGGRAYRHSVSQARELIAVRLTRLPPGT